MGPARSTLVACRSDTAADARGNFPTTCTPEPASRHFRSSWARTAADRVARPATEIAENHAFRVVRRTLSPPGAREPEHHPPPNHPWFTLPLRQDRHSPVWVRLLNRDPRPYTT